MKRRFYFKEKIINTQEIEVDVPVDKMDEYDKLVSEVEDCINSERFDDSSDVFKAFKDKFGKDNVNFIKDYIPTVELE